MELPREQRRTLLALACAVAWADGVVTPEERDVVRELMHRFGADPDDVEHWLQHGPPEADFAALPDEISDMFFYEALRLAQADGDVSDEELTLLDGVVARTLRDRPDGVPLGRTRLVKGSGPGR